MISQKISRVEAGDRVNMYQETDEGMMKNTDGKEAAVRSQRGT